MARARIEFDDKQLRANIRNLGRNLDRHITGIINDEADYATAQLKARAPWSDRTGAARAGLLAVANRLGPGSHELILSYSVHYGIYLETANGGENAVIGPFLPVLGRKVMSDLSQIIDRLQRAR